MFIRIEEANKTYHSQYPVQALKNVTLTIKKGEWITVMGPSGSGKTTLLHVIGGIDRLDDGLLEIEGEALSDFSNQKLQQFRRETIGFIFQHDHLFDQYSVLENVMIAQ